jgi:uncharacterized protein (DUF2252 family)
MSEPAEPAIPLATATPAQRSAAGRALRQQIPRRAHAHWTPPPDRADPIDTLIAQGKTRSPALLPIRYARMRTDPFGFLRGAAAIMAEDLAQTPSTPIRLQSCGDAHLGNFGAYASPEGVPVFDINDFDEALPAPFEWDLKRLATSLAVSARVADVPHKQARKLACTAASSYRNRIAELAAMAPLTAWNRRVDLNRAIAGIDAAKLRAKAEAQLQHVLETTVQHYDLVDHTKNGPRIRDKPGLVWHDEEHALLARQAFASYALTLQEDRRVLLQRHALRDVASKVVGVGSVGLVCAVALLTAGDGAPLLLQIKQAQASVLAPFAGASDYANHGERVVVGQRMMQATADIFLGWTTAEIDSRAYYVRRLKDQRLAQLGTLLEQASPFYAALCGQTLARAHARTGDPALLAGYLGTGPAMDEAIGDFAAAYADQTETDWRALLTAIDSGRIVAASLP